MLFHTWFTLFTYIYVGDEEEKEKEEFIEVVEEASKESGSIKRKFAHFNFLGPTWLW